MKILHLLYESKGDYFGIGGVGVRAYEIYKYLPARHLMGPAPGLWYDGVDFHVDPSGETDLASPSQRPPAISPEIPKKSSRFFR